MAVCAAAHTCAAAVLTNAVDLSRAVFVKYEQGARFCVEATYAGYQNGRFYFEDATGAMYFGVPNDSPCQMGRVHPGDRIRIRGVIGMHSENLVNPLMRYYAADCYEIETVGHGEPPVVQDVDGEAFVSGKCDFKIVRLRGVVRDVFLDDIDPAHVYLVIQSGGHAILFPRKLGDRTVGDFRKLIGAEVSVLGRCDATPSFTRRRASRLLIGGEDECCKVLRPPTQDVFDVPDAGELQLIHPESLSALGRRRATGEVLALWDRKAMLFVRNQQCHKVEFATDRLPACGEWIEVSGFPETDLYSIILTRAVWRTATRERTDRPPTPKKAAIKDLASDPQGRVRPDSVMGGSVLTVSGTVCALPGFADARKRLVLEDGGFTLPVEASAITAALDGLALGSRVSVTGVFVLDADAWRPNVPFPQVREALLAPRGAADVRVVSRPSWWTSARLLAVIALLFVALIGFFVWNRWLHHLVERKGRELYRAQIDKVSSDLRVTERGRLAVELHDSLAQNLAGVAMEIETAVRSDDPKENKEHLDFAAKALRSCRDELRNSLWDLRNEALEESDMNAAIRRTLVPHLKGVELAVRFNVPRERFSDNTAHEVLRIVRELSVNGIRHGHANRIQVAGGIEGDRLMFSVRDNGVGFDVANAPGVSEGHFGLQGVRERLRRLSGELTLESRPGRGTRAVVSIRIPTVDEEGTES